MSLPNNFNHSIYPSDLLVFLMVRIFLLTKLAVTFDDYMLLYIIHPSLQMIKLWFKTFASREYLSRVYLQEAKVSNQSFDYIKEKTL